MAKTRNGAAQRPPGRELPFGGVWKYAPAPESTESVRIAARYELFVGGAWRRPRSGRHFATIDPATETVLAQVADAGAADVDAAVKAAARAFPAWRASSGEQRSRHLFRVARLLLARAREFAVLETLDSGRPITATRDVDVPLAAQHFFHHAGWADKLELAFPGGRPEPLGVVGQVIGAHCPLLRAAWKVAPALAAGNTVVLKPAASTPLTALRLCELLQQAELPPGVVNVVTGGDATGAALVRHAGLAKVAFTGSTAAGARIQQALAGRDTARTLALGGKAVHVVFEDAASDDAVEAVVRGSLLDQGLACSAGSRLLVQESVHDLVVARLERRMARIRVGNPLDKNTDLGAIPGGAQLARLRALVDDGVQAGCELFQPRGELPAKGFWFAPALLTGVSMAHRIAREELSGPVLPVLTFRTPEEAVEQANDTAHGLSAAVWTDKGARAAWMAARLKAGVVWGNTSHRFDPCSPFGGIQEAGFGRDGGVAGLRAYVRQRGDLAPG